MGVCLWSLGILWMPELVNDQLWRWSGCSESTLLNRAKQHTWTQKNSAIYKHFGQYQGWDHKSIFQCDGKMVDRMHLQMNTVRENTRIIAKADHWQVLAFKEPLKIKDKRPSLNNGVKAARLMPVLTIRRQITEEMKTLHLLTSDKWQLIRLVCTLII